MAIRPFAERSGAIFQGIMASSTGPELERLIQLLARLPGLGPRSARRAALHLIRKREALLAPLADAVRDAGSLDDAEAVLAARGIRTELAYERELFGAGA